MATKSILKEIRINNNISARRLVCALENAGRVAAPSVALSRTVSNATEKEIKLLFGAKDNDDRV